MKGLMEEFEEWMKEQIGLREGDDIAIALIVAFKKLEELKEKYQPHQRCPFCFAVGFSKDVTLEDHLLENHEVAEMAELIAEQSRNKVGNTATR